MSAQRNSAAAVLAAVLVGDPLPARGQHNSHAQVERGHYLAIVSNCQGCHTASGEAPFTGARGLETPFGVIYSPNLTFEPETGLGLWSKDDFWRALHEGVSRDGSYLYPAFPYPHFTKMPREDVDALYDFLSTLQPQKREKPDNELPFPLRWRTMLAGWNAMFFTPGVFEPDPEKSAEWNRGAYLVEGPGHCAGCHTEKNLAGADKTDRHLAGGQMENWSAPSIRAGRNGGLAHWSTDDIVTFLKTGRNRHSAAFSTMSEVIELSTQHMTEEDLRAMAIYLQDLDSPERAVPPAADAGVMAAGAAIYFDNCSACHVSDGSGVPSFFAPLAGSNKVANDDATTVIRIILEGGRSVPTSARPTPLSMPAFDWKLTDEQVAAVATFVRQSWGNRADVVTPGEVEALREALRH